MWINCVLKVYQKIVLWVNMGGLPFCSPSWCTLSERPSPCHWQMATKSNRPLPFENTSRHLIYFRKGIIRFFVVVISLFSAVFIGLVWGFLILFFFYFEINKMVFERDVKTGWSLLKLWFTRSAHSSWLIKWLSDFCFQTSTPDLGQSWCLEAEQ